MAEAFRAMMSDSSTFILTGLSTLTAAYASYRANDTLLKVRQSPSRNHTPSLSEQLIDENSQVLEGPLAFAFPLICAVSILLLFFFIKSLGVVLTALSTVSGLFAVAFVCWPFAEMLLRRLRACGLQLHSNATVVAVIAGLPALTIITYWLFTGHWLANNIIGVSICILFPALCRVPNLKVTSILFAGLFVYDIFFVFFSEKVFGRNVMVEVATSTPTNPLAIVASFFNFPVQPVKNLSLPAKLVIPSGGGSATLLGLGDIILPEILLTYLLEFDLRVNTASLRTGYFVRALVMYALAIFTSFYCNYAFGVAQPALLYIVPALLGTSLTTARSKGQLDNIWNGFLPSQLEYNEITAPESHSLLTSKSPDVALPQV